DRLVAELLADLNHPVATLPQMQKFSVPAMAAQFALLSLVRGDPGSARSELYPVLDVHRESIFGIGLPALLVGALLEREDGEVARAESDVMNALAKIAWGKSWLFAPDSLAVAGALRADVGADLEAIRLLAAAGAARERTGIVRQYEIAWDEDAKIAALRERVGSEAFDEAWAAG